MKLYLIRHAVAEDREEFRSRNSNDELRPLTNKGRKKFSELCVTLHSYFNSVDLTVTSPYTRAKETAEIFVESIGRDEFIEAPELVPHSPPVAFAKWLRNHARSRREVAVIGHEPFLSLFASYLLTGSELPILSFKKSGVACLEISTFSEMGPRSAHLAWLISPKLIQICEG